MGFQCGLVGLPNVGKSTLFNALTRAETARAENFPFCTIDPNIGWVDVPDSRLTHLSEMVGAARTIPARMQFVDIAGLIRGSANGEGLGNQFLGHIREMDAVAYVLRCFDDPDIIHVEGHIDPVSDAQTLGIELMLADLASLEKRLPALSKHAKSGDKDIKAQCKVIQDCIDELTAGGSVNKLISNGTASKEAIDQLNLLTTKPVLYVANVAEDDLGKENPLAAQVIEYANQQGAPSIVLSAQLEQDLSQLSLAEAQQWLTSQGVGKTGLDQFIRCGYELLDLITFFTAGPKEARAWTILNGSNAVTAAACIHTDFSKHFIRAEVTDYDQFVACNGSTGAREQGKTRLEGKEYLMHDGDVVYFRIGRG